MGNQADMQEMIELFEAELRLCGLDSSQKLAVLSEGENLKDYAEAFLRAGDNLGAQTAHVHLASANTAGADAYLGDLSGNPLTNNPAALAVLKEADLVIGPGIPAVLRRADRDTARRHARIAGGGTLRDIETPVSHRGHAPPGGSR